jgi:glycine/D-amino acid oxidase-like deaminating enzyme
MHASIYRSPSQFLLPVYRCRSTAYHLQELECKENIHLIEVTTEPFCGASGYAAGFVASNWYSSAVLPLGKLSFSLHKNIAEKHNGRDKWGYSGSTGVSLGAPVDPDSPDDTAEHEGGEDWLLQGTSRAQVAERNKGHTKQIDYKPSWLRVGKRQECELLSTEESTAQV